MFGEPQKGVHAYRIFDVAIVDVVATFIVAYVLSRLTGVKFIVMLIGLFAGSIIMHRLFCVRTTVDKLLFN